MGAERHPAEPNETPGEDVAASGVRLESERETTPAPATVRGGDASPPSARPTDVPRYDVAAHAFESSLSLRQPPPPRLPHALAVPIRSLAAAPDTLELRAAFVLLHVDGHATVAEIAALTAIALEPLLEVFVTLSAQGLVTLT